MSTVNSKNMLSIVIIGRNEEKHLKSCIESVINVFKTNEIIYVDSASTDSSVKIAKRFPIKILQLKKDWVLTPAAGRYIGYLNSSGKYIMFLDGDSIMASDWPEISCKFLDSHPEMAGVAGELDEIYLNGNGIKIDFIKNRYKQKKNIEEVRTLGGNSIYRRSVLNQVGSFNPYLPSEEERELGLRIRNAGYKLVRIKEKMAVTYSYSRNSFYELNSKLHSNYFSFAPALICTFRNGMGWQYISERMGFVVQFIAIIISSFVLIIISFYTRKMLLWLVDFSLFVLTLNYIIVVRKKNIKDIMQSIAKRMIVLGKTLKQSLKLKLPTPDKYPTDATLIKDFQNNS